MDTAGFFKELIELSYISEKFRVLLFTHETAVACSLLKCSSLQRPIQIVETIRCCRWNGSDRETVDVSRNVRAGCRLSINAFLEIVASSLNVYARLARRGGDGPAEGEAGAVGLTR